MIDSIVLVDNGMKVSLFQHVQGQKSLFRNLEEALK